MSDAEGSTSQSQSQPQRSSRGDSRSHRRGRGGRGRGGAERGGSFRGRGGAPRPQPQVNSQTASGDAQPSAGTASETIAQPAASTRGSRSRRGQPSRGGRGQSHRSAPKPGPQRAFGGHLTTDTERDPSAVPNLSGDAPEFVPGQPLSIRSTAAATSIGKRAFVKPPKSTAEDLGTRIHEDISNINYECTICTDDVVRNSSVWSCTVCWTVIHLKCVKKWHDNQRKQQNLQNPQPSRQPSWRCPGCNSSLTDEPGSYHCWCGKDINPQPASKALPPHSCGQTCSKPRATCPHPCSLQCHAGPCPPCDLMGPSQSCFCGKNTSRKLCRETDYENGWSCHEVCGDLMPCGEHFCSKPCHSGLCGDCDVGVDVKCYCGRVEKTLHCYEREEPQQSYSKEDDIWFEGSFSCETPCRRRATCTLPILARCGDALPLRQVKARRAARPSAADLPGRSPALQQVFAGATIVSKYAIEGLVVAARRLFSTKSAVTAVEQYCNLRSPVARAHPSVDSIVSVVQPVDTLLSATIVMLTMYPAPSVHSWLINGVPAAKRSCTANHAICRSRAAAGDGECEDAERPGKLCGQACGKTKLFCEHPCQNSCHGQAPCNESAPCSNKVVVACPCGLRKQEVKCLASSSNTTPSRPELKCDDECLRQERNRRLAAALNVDMSVHTDDHVPYSDTTLRLFQENQSWAEAQEREFRVFASSANEVRLRYKPMASPQRQFLHSLASDYGLESRSEDQEPQRYVVVYKGPRFVSAPTKTIARCVQIRAQQAAAAIAASRPPTPPMIVQEPFNAYLLTVPRFGLTVDELKPLLAADMATQPSIHFAINFLPDTDEVLMRASASYSAFLTPTALEQSLTSLKSRLAATIRQQQLAENIMLCHIDGNDNITRRENLSKQAGSGWNAVAGRAAARTASPMTEELTARGSGKRLLGLRKKKVDKDKERQWAALDGDVEC
ncbi:hypothetical protein S7711_02275 [Stachybotrys chartarum IBT 7711]|uniref:R3H domain-containing protein n=1 Tax=Stachybotrys chartarum (strain CBS 109288 / IBT 7711) TaxID=1280523 RepID=A0A084AZE7_STACB|nr:hypothetical protein S7711_02275 [Stachybotrys chartarum IBT 7711]